MRVVLLNQYYAPDTAATAQLLGDLGAGLAAAGHEVTAVCCSRAYADPSVRYPRRETVDGVAVRRTFSTGFGRGNPLGRACDYATFLLGATAALLFRRKPDVVVSLSTPPMVALLGWLLARLRGARSVYWVMDVYPDLAYELGVLRPGSTVSRVFDALTRFTLARSDAVVALGDTMAEHLRARGARNVTAIHNWADGDAIRPLPSVDNPLRKEWDWNGRFVALYSGNMGLAHEFDTMLDAAERLRDRDDIRFAFVGGGPRRAEFAREVERRGLANVELRPYVSRERLGHSLTAGDAHLVSLRERMPGLLVPSKIYGILAAGRPTLYVGPDRGEIADILREGKCGVRVAVGDGERLAAAVAAYADDRTRAAEDGRRARQAFDRRYTLRHGLRAFETVLGPSGAAGGTPAPGE